MEFKNEHLRDDLLIVGFSNTINDMANRYLDYFYFGVGCRNFNLQQFNEPFFYFLQSNDAQKIIEG